MPPDGHCEVRLTRRYEASPAEVWRALTDPESVARWLGVPVDTRVLASEPERVLELDWRYGDEDRSVVRFELAPDGDGTLLALDHRRIDERFGMTYISRWTGALRRFDAELRA